MNTVCIRFTDCKDCPYIVTSGAFGAVPHRPLCVKMKRRTLPYTEHINGCTTRVDIKPGIPDWCPLLEKNNG